MKFGAIAFLDVLGFKDIWRDYPGPNNDGEPVIERLRELRQRGITSFQQSITECDPKLWHIPNLKLTSFPILEVIFMSDSIMAACWFDQLRGSANKIGDVNDDMRMLASQSLWCLALRISQLIYLAGCSDPARGKPRLCFRGCIAIGSFRLEDGCIAVGPAVDEAVSLERQADAAIVWLAPSTSWFLVDNRKPTSPWCLMEYKVPLKGNGQLETFVVNPMALTGGERPRSDWRKQILSIFDRCVEPSTVLHKRQNTQAFLDAASRRMDEHQVKRSQ